ncbi:MAG TPA: biotin transporter BioY [Firmicutes bacterium]|nr:biotin transporter BioY [Bacillota bacterium]
MTTRLQHVRGIVRAALFAALMGSGGILALQVPISTVPFTLQTMFVIMAGLFLGPRYAPFSVVIYLTMGAIGLPVFSKGGAGIGILLGPTGGYLIGFIVTAWLVGVLGALVRVVTAKQSGLRLVGYILAAVMGLSLGTYLLGTLRLAALLQIGFLEAALVGVVPFLAAELLKVLLAAGLIVSLERRGLYPNNE